MTASNWEELEAACNACTACELGQTRKNLVFGVGNRQADLMFIGEGPGAQEDEQGIPFVGRAGQLLDDMLAAVDIRREDVYIANMVKCRPPENRDPLQVELDACLPWLRRQTALVAPKAVVCLGRVAACRIIGEDFKITRDHGKAFHKNGALFMGIYHPSYLLRDPRRRPEAWEDMKELTRLLAGL